MTLAVTERSIGHVRRITRAHLRYWDLAEADSVTLLGVTELLINVLKHTAEQKARLLMQATADGVCVTVSDRTPRLPGIKGTELLGENGRGLWLLRAMADGFGITPTPSGKDLWFRVECATELVEVPRDEE